MAKAALAPAPYFRKFRLVIMAAIIGGGIAEAPQNF
jgi:hypothetical protein